MSDKTQTEGELWPQMSNSQLPLENKNQSLITAGRSLKDLNREECESNAFAELRPAAGSHSSGKMSVKCQPVRPSVFVCHVSRVRLICG